MTTKAAIAVADETTVEAGAPRILKDPIAMRYNIVIAWDADANEGRGAYVVSPGSMPVPNAFGMGTIQWPSPAFIKWYIIPNPEHANVHFDPEDGIVFRNPPPWFHGVEYGTDFRSASVRWENPNSNPISDTYVYDIHVIVGNDDCVIDPDVENQGPPT